MAIFFHGNGDTGLPPTTFDQVQKDSDRAAGLVVGSLVEQRLTEFLQVRFVQGATARKVNERLFHSSGALGSFSVKIDIAFLSGCVSEEAHRELRTIKNIRNLFAHRIGIDSFKHAEISSRCSNLRLVDRYVAEPDPDVIGAIDRGEAPKPSKALFSFPGAREHLADPRQRYVTSGMVFNFFLSSTAETSWINPSGPAI